MVLDDELVVEEDVVDVVVGVVTETVVVELVVG
jgi:hypothetical protein